MRDSESLREAPEARVRCEPTSPGPEVRDPSAGCASQRHQEAPPGVPSSVAADETSAEHLPKKQNAAFRQPSPCMRSNS